MAMNLTRDECFDLFGEVARAIVEENLNRPTATTEEG